MPIHVNSAEAYHAERVGGGLTKRQALILHWLQSHPGAWTDRQIAERLGFPDMNCVRPRITELIDMGLLSEASHTKCPATGKTVRQTMPANPQLELPL